MIINFDTLEKSEQLQIDTDHETQDIEVLLDLDRVKLYNRLSCKFCEFPLYKNRKDLILAMYVQIQHLSDVIESGDFVDQENLSMIDLIVIRAMLASALYHLDPNTVVIGKC